MDIFPFTSIIRHQSPTYELFLAILLLNNNMRPINISLLKPSYLKAILLIFKTTFTRNKERPIIHELPILQICDIGLNLLLIDPLLQDYSRISEEFRLIQLAQPYKFDNILHLFVDRRGVYFHRNPTLSFLYYYCNLLTCTCRLRTKLRDVCAFFYSKKKIIYLIATCSPEVLSYAFKLNRNNLVTFRNVPARMSTKIVDVFRCFCKSAFNVFS